MNRDEEHLYLLSIFHFVFGGFLFLVACFPLLHVGMGVLILSGTLDRPHDFPPFIGWFFVIFPAIFIICGWIMAGLILSTGWALRQHRARTFCTVVAALECLFFPLGTVLGVFTIVVLARGSVMRLFDGNPFGPWQTPPAPHAPPAAGPDSYPPL